MAKIKKYRRKANVNINNSQHTLINAFISSKAYNVNDLAVFIFHIETIFCRSFVDVGNCTAVML